MVLAVIIIALAFIINAQPPEFKITRSIVINAKPEAVFSHINNLHQWEVWSPWAKLDPNSKGQYSGATEGVGSSFAWSGNDKVGVGAMTIIESKPSELVKLRLDFQKPMQATNTAEFNLTPQGDSTLVTWEMYGSSNFIGKAMGLLGVCEKIVGGQFETGLASLKQVVEGAK